MCVSGAPQHIDPLVITVHELIRVKAVSPTVHIHAELFVLG